jgi:hypothetical protein
LAVNDWSLTPSANVSLATFDLRESYTNVGDFNGITRQLMADIKAFSNTVPVAADYLTKAAGVFSGTQPIYTGRGAYLHHNSSALTSGRIFMQAAGGSTPAGMAAGDALAEF